MKDPRTHSSLQTKGTKFPVRTKRKTSGTEKRRRQAGPERARCRLHGHRGRLARWAVPTGRVGPSRTHVGWNDQTFGSRRAFAAILPRYPPSPSPQEALPARYSGPAVFSERGGEVAARDEVGKERCPCLVSGITPMGPMGRTSLRLLRTALGLQAGAGRGQASEGPS